MAFMDTPAKRQQGFWYFGASLLLLSLLAFPVINLVADPGPPDAGAEGTTTTTAAAPAPAGGCGLQEPHFFARDTEGNQFGSAGPEEAQAAHLDFQARRHADGALSVATEETIVVFTDPQVRLQKTIDAMADPKLWCDREALIEAKLVQASSIEVVEMSGSYRTLDMVDKDRMIPEIFQVNVEAAPFKVLRYTFSDGTQLNYKLNCGYQIVLMEFPLSVPGAPPAPPAQSVTPTPVAPSKPGQPGKPEQPTKLTVPTTVPKCVGTGTCGTPHSGSDDITPTPLPPTPGSPGDAEGSAEDPGDGVFPQGGSMSGGSTSSGTGTETGGTTGFGDIAPTELTPEPAAPPLDPGLPA